MWTASYLRKQMKKTIKVHLHTTDASRITSHSWRAGRAVELIRAIETNAIAIHIDSVVALGRWASIRSLDPYLRSSIYELMVHATVTPTPVVPPGLTVVQK